jgi:hypothetical protein
LVWVDKHKGILYVVGAALAAGTAGALYYTKTGGTLANAAVDPFKGKKFEVLQVGTLSFAGGTLGRSGLTRAFSVRRSSQPRRGMRCRLN